MDDKIFSAHLGDSRLYYFKKNQIAHQTLDHSVSQMAVYRGDAFLLCTDGFWEYATEEEMQIDLYKSTSVAQLVSYMLNRIGNSEEEKPP